MRSANLKKRCYHCIQQEGDLLTDNLATKKANILYFRSAYVKTKSPFFVSLLTVLMFNDILLLTKRAKSGYIERHVLLNLRP